MPMKYEGKKVISSRDAQKGDAGFVAGSDQVVVTLATEKTVKRSEVTETDTFDHPSSPPRKVEEPLRESVGIKSFSNQEVMMSKTYQGKNVRSSRDASDGDSGWVKDTDQVVISFDDGTQKTVKRSEVTETP